MWMPGTLGLRAYCRPALSQDAAAARELMERVKAKLDLKDKAKEWKKVTTSDVKDAGGGTLLQKHGSSVFRLLQLAYPEERYRPEHVRTKVPKRYWKDVTVRKQFMEEIAAQLGIRKPEEWKKVSRQQFLEMGGAGVLKEHGKSLRLAVAELIDGAAPYAPPTRQAHQTTREFLRAAAQSLGVTSIEDWRRVRNADIMALPGGASVLRRHGSSLFAALQHAFPEQEITLHCVKRVPRNHWEELKNQREALDKLAEKHGITDATGWRKLSYRDIVAEGLAQVLRKYGNSVFRMLSTVYPEKGMKEHECREHVTRHFWDSAENRESFMQRLRQNHRLEQPEDWRKITTHDIEAAGGIGLLNRYPSVAHLIQDFSGTGASLFHLRPHLPASFWDDDDNVALVVKDLGEKLRIRQPEDWLRVSREQVCTLRGQGLVRNVGLSKALEITYPEHSSLWALMRAPDFKARRSVQRSMAVSIGEIFCFAAEDYNDLEATAM